MAKLDNTELIRMLQAAAQDEHAAIIQYLRHAYRMGEGELACEIESIAREEMRHFWILSRWIVRLGGDPTIDRGFTDLAGAAPPEWMNRDVAAEDRAITMYREYLNRVTDPDLRADLAYILADELRHKDDFVHFVDKAARELAEAASEPDAAEETAAESLASVDKNALDWGVQHEYAALLQYLVHSFRLMDTECDISRELEMQAINEMQHMGWFGEELAEFGEEMPLEHHGVALPHTPVEMLEANVQLEQETSAQYRQFMTEMTDPDLKGVVDDARGQEDYHEQLFTRLLKKVQAAAGAAKSNVGNEGQTAAADGWTIGSLKRKER